MTQSSPSGEPWTAELTFPGAAPVPYAFERIQRDSEGGEVDRLEAQNVLFEKVRPLDQLPPLPPGGEILDLGSGTGFWSQRLAALVPQGRITCLDRSGELLDMARQRLEAAGIRGTRFLRQDLRGLDLPEGAFDLAFTSVTLAHVQEREAVLGRLIRALKPGGWIACFEPVQQSRKFCELHPPCTHLNYLMDRLVDVAEERGSDLAVGLKIAHDLDRAGMEQACLRSYGGALHGEDAATCFREVLLPLARAYLKHRWEADLLDRRMEAAEREASTPHLWVDFRRAVALARKPME